MTRLKRAGPRADPGAVSAPSLSCPICSADLPLAGDERGGDEVYCTYCGAPCRLVGEPDSEDCSVEEDC